MTFKCLTLYVHVNYKDGLFKIRKKTKSVLTLDHLSDNMIQDKIL